MLIEQQTTKNKISMDPNLRNLKDFLTLYNKVTELCFSRCVETLYERDLTNSENTCIDRCVIKFARFNQKMMNVYVEVQSDMNQKRMQEIEANQKQLEQAQAQAQAQSTASTPAAASISTLRTTPASTKATAFL